MVAMTTSLTQELSSFVVTKTCCHKAEISAVLRFAGGLHIMGGHLVVEAELGTASVARRLGQDQRQGVVDGDRRPYSGSRRGVPLLLG